MGAIPIFPLVPFFLFGVFLVGGEVCRYKAEGYSMAASNVEQMSSVAINAGGVNTVQKELWRTFNINIAAFRSALEDLHTFGPSDMEMFGGAMIEASNSLATLGRSVDEYLVFISEKKFFPVNFDVSSVMNTGTYEKVKTQLQEQNVLTDQELGCAHRSRTRQ